MRSISTLFLLLLSLLSSAQKADTVEEFMAKTCQLKFIQDSIRQQQISNNCLPCEPVIRRGCGLAKGMYRNRASVSENKPATKDHPVVREPIYVVDGVIQPDIKKLNVDDIKDISILAPPSSCTIFGTQASCGAIVITLKMRYDKIIIKDFLDKTPIAKATVSLVFPLRKDTLRYIADDSGVIISNTLPKPGGCEMIVSAAGYQTDASVFDRMDQLSSGTIYLNRDFKLLHPVVISTITCQRMTRCGVRCVKIIGCEMIKLEEKSVKSIHIFPNPVNRGSSFRIQNELDQDKVLHLRVFHSNGSLVGEQIVKGVKGENQFSLRTEATWASGIYFVQLLYENGRIAASGKIVVQ